MVKHGKWINVKDAPFRFIRCQYCGMPVDVTKNRLSDVSMIAYVPDYPDYIEDDYGAKIFTETLDYIQCDPDVTSPILSESGDVIMAECGHEIVSEILYKAYNSVSTPLCNCPFCGAQYTRGGINVG